MKECIICYRIKDETAFEKTDKWMRNQCKDCRYHKKLEWSRKYSKTPKGRAGQRLRSEKYRQTSKGQMTELLYRYSPRMKYNHCRTTHMKRYGRFDVSLNEFESKYLIDKCGCCGLPFDSKRLKRVWENDYKEFWHERCNGFKGKMTKLEFKELIGRIYDRLK